jgi:hypothetical protein
LTINQIESQICFTSADRKMDTRKASHPLPARPEQFLLLLCLVIAR